MESKGFIQMMMKLKPDTIEDIVVMISLYRPGPMDQIPRYIKNKNNPEHIEYTHESLKNILNVTYGCMLYQEQVMQIFRDLAGYSLGRADIVRRAMGKKKIDVMNKERAIFVEGAKKNNIDEESANKIFDEMAEFAKYAFNKSHAAAYAVVTYQTAYLKAHFKEEFMASTMNSMIGNLKKIPEYIEECKSLGIEVLKPDINESYGKFAVINGKIRFALESIKNVGENAIDEIVKERKINGKYLSFVDFCKRVSLDVVNKKCIESLVMAGCFDEIEKDVNRYDILDSYEKIIDNVNNTKRNNYVNQMNFFDIGVISKKSDIEIKKTGRNLSKKEMLNMEKEMLGLYVSGHPLDEYKDYILKNSSVTSKKLNDIIDSNEFDTEKNEYDSKLVTICGMITEIRKLTTRSNKQMLFAKVDDLYGSIEAVIFPNIYARFLNIIQKDTVVKITGKVSLKENDLPKILVSNLEVVKIQNTKKIYIRIPKDKLDLEPRVIGYIKDLNKEYNGTTPVYIYYDGTNKVKLLNKSMWLICNNEVNEKLNLAFGEENVKIK